MNGINEPTPQPQSPQLQSAEPTETNYQGKSETYYEHANFSARLGAALVDGIILLAIAIPTTLLLEFLMGQSFDLGRNSPFDLLIAVIAVIYNVAFLTLRGATIGKQILHIRVVDTNYQPIKLSQALIRETTGKILSGVVFDLGYLWVAIDANKQAWHDKIAKTFVIYNQSISQSEYLENQQDKRSHLPLVLIVLSVVESIQPLSLVFVILPKEASVYKNFNAASSGLTISYILAGLILLVVLAQLIYGVLLMINQNKNGSLTANQTKTAKIVLVVALIAAVISFPIMVASTLAPMFNLVNVIK